MTPQQEKELAEDMEVQAEIIKAERMRELELAKKNKRNWDIGKR